MRYRLPGTAVHCFREMRNREMNLPDGFCVRQPVEVEISPSDGGEVECPKETHERVDKQLATLRTRVAVIVTEMPFNRGHNATVNDAGLPRCAHICGVHGVEVEVNFGHTLQQSSRTEKCPLGGQSCHVL